MLSRGLGLFRDVVMAGFFGTSTAMSAFVVAFTIPNLFRRLFGEGALSAAFIPVFVEARHTSGDQAAWKLARSIITLVTIVLLLFTLAGELICLSAPRLMPLSPVTEMVLLLLRIMLPYMVFICLAALSMAILNSFGHFAVPAFTPCLLNIIWLCAVLLVCPIFSVPLDNRVFVVAWAVLFAGVMQLSAQFPMLFHFGYRPGFSLRLDDPRVNRVLLLMGPAALGLAITQFNVLADRLLATWVGPWAPAALFFSERLIYFPLGIFATALSTVLLPTFSGQAADLQLDTIKNTIVHSLRSLMFVMIPAAAGLFVLARPIVEMIFQWKAFDSTSTWYTMTALMCYAPGLIVFSLAKIFVPAFYALQDTKTPLRIGLLTVAINLTINICFIVLLPLHYKHAGIAAATVLAESFYAVTLVILLQRKIDTIDWQPVIRSTARVGAATFIMAVAARLLLMSLESSLHATLIPTKIGQILCISVTIGLSTAIYAAMAFLLRCPELRELLNLRRKRSL